MAKKNKLEITTLEEAKQAMSDINKFDNLLARLYEQEANAISVVRVKYNTGEVNAKRQTFEALRKVRIKQLEIFANKNRREWNGRQSQQTAFGTFGYRKGQNCVSLVKKVCKNLDEAVKKAKEFFPEFIRTKEEINKEMFIDQMKTLDKEKLQQAGLKIGQKESFFIKTLFADQLEEATKKLKSA